MALTPLDVRKQHFRRVMRGVDADEVAVFLGLVAGEMETLIREHAVLAEQVTSLRARLDEYQSLERSLRDAVVVAQGMREEARRQAERESELMLSKADLEVKGRLRNAESRLADLRRELGELKGERQNYLIRLRALIETHMRMVEASEARFEALDSAGPTDARAETIWRSRSDHAAPAGAMPDGPAGPAQPPPPNPAAEQSQSPPAEARGSWG
jgi:cell division initiation protein